MTNAENTWHNGVRLSQALFHEVFFTDKRLSIGVEDWSAPAYCWKLLSCEILFALYLYVFFNEEVQ